VKELSRIRAAAGRQGGIVKSRAKRKAARQNAKLGGRVTSEAKAAAARANGRKGGRPCKTESQRTI